MFSSKRIALLLCVCSAIIGSLAIHHLYERHLSSEFRRLMIAADDEHESYAEQAIFIHDARKAARTEKDIELLRNYEQANDLMLQANETVEHAQQALEEEQHDIQNLSEKFAQDRATTSADQVKLGTDVEEARIDARRKLNQNIESVEKSKKQMREAIALHNSIRKELGLPDLPYKTN